MPQIEDVEFLKANGVKQSYVFMINSKSRDKQSYPTPSEFVVAFDTPFRNVVGMDVLDASISRTMYTIDVYNNKLGFFIHDSSFNTSTLTTSNFSVVSIEPGDYTIQTLIPALNTAMSMHLNGDNSQSIISITAESVSNPPEVKNLLKFTCPYEFAFNMDATVSTIAEAIGFDQWPQASESTKSVLNQRYTTMYVNTVGTSGLTGNLQLYHSVDVSATTALGNSRTVFQGPHGVITSYTGSVAQSFTLASAGYLSQFSVAFASVGTGSASWNIYSGSNLSTATQVTSGTIGISSVDGSLSESSNLNVSLAIGTYWLQVSGASIFYNDVISSTTTMKVNPNSSPLSAFQALDSNGIYYNMCGSIVVNDPYHTIVAPGIYNLSGEPYILLRCPEIEDASFRSMSYTNTAHSIGIAKFTIAGVVGFADNRFDFSSIPTREFHPIGKLSRLTLRFERSTGELYDFKGVNNTLTIALSYYEAKAPEKFEPILNPNYLMDFHAYRKTEEEQEGDSDDLEDEDENFNRDSNFDFEWRRQEMEALTLGRPG